MKFKKLLTLLLVGVVGLTVACGPSTERPDGGESEYNYETKINANKTQLFISNFNGAFGDSWLKATAQRFSELYKDVSFEAGKKGVQVWIDNSKQGGSDVLAGLDSNRADICFTEFCFYSDFVNSGKVLDITDIMTEKLTEYGETKSIVDKLSTEQNDFLNVNGHYYCIPHYQAFRGITYDIDVFEENLLYFALDSDNGNDGFICALDDDYSYGPDGLAGTYDDGLPATYADFFKLCEKMVDLGITPIMWSGSQPAYFTEFLTGLAADYEGLENMTLNFSFNGTATTLVDNIDKDGNVTLKAATNITNENGYLVTSQAGKYYALSFAEQLIDGNYCDLRSFGTLSHTECQKEYIYSNFSSDRTTVAMLIESNYWENEAADGGYFKQMEKKYTAEKASRTSRRFGFMPFPKATEEQVGEGVTLVDYLYSFGFINANVPQYKKQLALDFLQFCYTDKSLQEFTAITGNPKALNYELGEAESLMSPYAKSVFNIRKNASIVYPYSNNALYKENASGFSGTWFWSAEIDSLQGRTPYSTPSVDIRDYKLSALQYFDGIQYHFRQSAWNNSYSKYWSK